MAVFPSELKGILNHLLHQLEGLLNPGPGQGGEVHHRRVHLHCQKTHSVLLPAVAPETVYLVQHRRMDMDLLQARTMPHSPLRCRREPPAGCICSVMAATRPVLNSYLILEYGFTMAI